MCVWGGGERTINIIAMQLKWSWWRPCTKVSIFVSNVVMSYNNYNDIMCTSLLSPATWDLYYDIVHASSCE